MTTLARSKRKIFCSTVAFDLGARYSGVFLLNHAIDEVPTAKSAAAATIVMPQDQEQFVYSMKGRTATRHRLRSSKRFKLARRLVFQVSDALMIAKGIKLDESNRRRLDQAMSSLLRRRGFSRIEAEVEVDSGILENVESSVFAEHPSLGSYFAADRTVAQQWEELSQNPASVSALRKALPTPREFLFYLRSEFPEFADQVKNYERAINTLIQEVESIDRQVNLGHKQRAQYFLDIKQDLKRDSRLNPVFDAFGTQERFWRFICNVSNLQLRALRWYFDEPNQKLSEHWNPDKFKKVWIRSLKYFHPDTSRRDDLSSLIDEIEISNDILDALCSVDPRRTIPPYEDQNNRRPPFDQTLWLNPLTLTKRYGNKWRIWSQKLRCADNILADQLDEILVYTDRATRRIGPGRQPLDPVLYFDSYVLQRALDRSAAFDPYALRALACDKHSQGLYERYRKLSNVLGSQHLDAFLSFAREYYAEITEAKNGLWFSSPEAILEKANIHPPMKKKVLDLLIGNLLDADRDTGRKLREELWTIPIPKAKRRTTRSICALIETIRKDLGGDFRSRFLFVQTARDNNPNWKPKTAEQKSLLAVCEGMSIARSFLRERLCLTEIQMKRISSPYIFSQLYTLIETERNGFTATSLAAHLENRWRMSSDHNGLARCSRLPADCVRPFDGVLRKVLDRQAFEAAKLAASELMSRNDVLGSDIHLGVIVEANKFAFTASLADLKKNRQALNKAVNSMDVQKRRWISKEERIAQASCGICAYTGNEIDLNDPSSYEFDHIIPRSLTTASYGTIFNSEANLICVSKRGNQYKTDRQYDISDLDATYLAKVFGTRNVEEISAKIEQEVGKLVESGRIRYFDLLSDEEQKYVRHALFLSSGSDARKNVIRELASANRARVNGTQAWFVRSFISKLLEISSPWLERTGNQIYIRSWKSDAEQTSYLRKKLGEVTAFLAKSDIQPVASHSVDAMCAYANICGQDAACRFMGANPDFADAGTYSSHESLPVLHPQDVSLINVSARDDIWKKRHDSRPIFKEGIYAENYLPLILCKERLYIGFSIPSALGTDGNSVEVRGKSPLSLLKVLSLCLDDVPKTFSDRPLRYRIVKEKAYAILSKELLDFENTSVEERDCADALRSLTYFTQRIPVASKFYPKEKNSAIKNGKKFAVKDKVIQESDFNIKLSLGGRKYGYEAKGIIQLPAKNDWYKLISDPELDDKWGKSCPNFDLEDWLMRKMRMNASSSRHASHKRFASLPICCSPSGGFRFRRKNLDGAPIYQIHEIAGAKYSGFKSDANGVVDWGSPVLLRHLLHRNLIPLDNHLTRSGIFVPMSEWRIVEKNAEGIIIEVRPGSKDRCYLRVHVPFDIFRTWLQSANVVDIPVNPMLLPAEIKIPKAEEFANAARRTVKVFARPRNDRGKIVFERIGTIVIFQFVAGSDMADLRKAYNQAVCS